MEFKWKLSAGAATAALLAACGPGAEEAPAETGAAETGAPAGEAMAGDDTAGDDTDAMAAMAEAGEGEVGATADLDPQAKAVADLLLIRGHTMAGEALYTAGEREMARPHLSHPQMELYADNMQDLQQYGAQAAAEAGDRIVELGEADAPSEEVTAAVNATFAEIDAAIGNVGASLSQRAEALSTVLDTARVEYNISITDGAVTNAAEFQDAWGFIRAARGAFDTWREEFDAADGDAAAELEARLDELMALHDDPIPDGAPPALADFRSAVTQAQLAMLPFQG